MTEQEFVQYLQEVVEGAEEKITSFTRTFEEAGLLTSNKGLIVRLYDGSEFQITVVKSA